MTDLKAQTPSHTLDVTGKGCPYPLLLTKNQLEKMNHGDLLLVKTDNVVSVQDSIPRYVENQGYSMEKCQTTEPETWELYIKKV